MSEPLYRALDDPWEPRNFDRERREFLAAESPEERDYREWLESMENDQ